MRSSPVSKMLVLVGGGHAHVHVLKSFSMRPEPGARVTLVARDLETPYSGMLPGHIAGHYDRDTCHIDLAHLAQATGARLVHAEVVGLDPDRRRVILRGRPPLAYDVVSLDIGSTPSLTTPGARDHALPVKPVEGFLARWHDIVEKAEVTGVAPRVVIVGGGAGGVEAALAVHARLSKALATAGRPGGSVPMTLATRGELLDRFNVRARRMLGEELAARGIEVLARTEIAKVESGCLVAANDRRIPYDHALWATRAYAAPWLRTTGLALDEEGFVAVDASLRSTSHRDVFAAGDIASVLPYPREKAGVYAVRQGPPLAENLRRTLRGETTRPFRPQRSALALIGTGDRRAVAVRGPIASRGAAVWRWKEWIDRRWMRQYRDLPPMLRDGETPGSAPMRCGGCGAKVPADALERVLARLGEGRPSLNSLDDAAILPADGSGLMLQTVDHFRALVDDPYLFGRIAANHALGDIYAMGGQPLAALAIAALPPDAARIVEEDLFQMLAGGASILDAAGADLLGGHSAEGSELTLGFAVTGSVSPNRVLRKGGLRPGDRLILTKPLGTGALMAAGMQGRAKARWLEAAFATMQASSAEAARILAERGARACTDVTGFGLLGHLLEMIRASDCAAELDLARIPSLDGAEALIGSGLVSTLHPANERFRAHVEGSSADPMAGILFDPQTAGGLLAGVPQNEVEACLEDLRRTGYSRASVIGTVQAPRPGAARIRLR